MLRPAHADQVRRLDATRSLARQLRRGAARRRQLDPGFGSGGKVIVNLAAGTDRDVATGIAVLPNHHPRVIGVTDVIPGTSGTPSENLDVAVVGLKENGDFDPDFSGDGIVKFHVGASNDVPNRIAVAADGRLAISGCTGTGTSACMSSTTSGDESFVAVLNSDGTPAAFGTEPTRPGVVRFNQAGVTLIDRGVDVAFRPGGGLVALTLVETNAGAGAFCWLSVLRAFKDDGGDDPSFAGGQLTLPIEGADAIPTSMIEYGGRFYVTGSTRVGVDTDGFLARVDASGAGATSRRFDVRGRAVPADQAVTTLPQDLAVVPGVPPTLVAVGAMTSDAATDWAAVAFRDFDGDLAQAPLGDVVIPAAGNDALVAVAPDAAGRVYAAGRLTENSNVGYGNVRLLIDADKRCDLALAVADPAEVVFRGRAPATLTVTATNNGGRTCGGAVTVPAPYSAAPIATGDIPPGGTFTAAAVPLSYTGARRADDTILVTLSAAGDADTSDNTRFLHVVFSYCDMALTPVGARSLIPNEGTRAFELSLRNAGTVTCRGVRVGGASPYTVLPGRSVTDEQRAGAPKGARVGARVNVVLRVRASGDVAAANDAATIRPTVVGVGDSDVRRAGAHGFSGRARGGHGKLAAKRLRVSRVQVALLRKGGKGCAWLASANGTFTRIKASPKGACDKRRWLNAQGTTRWRYRLRTALRSGRYVIYSRATIAAGFGEGAFSPRDGNQRSFRVG